MNGVSVLESEATGIGPLSFASSALRADDALHPQVTGEIDRPARVLGHHAENVLAALDRLLRAVEAVPRHALRPGGVAARREGPHDLTCGGLDGDDDPRLLRLLPRDAEVAAAGWQEELLRGAHEEAD